MSGKNCQKCRILFLYIKVYVNRGFLLEERICNERREYIHAEIEHTTMSGMYELCHIFKFIIDGLNHGSFSQHKLVVKRHELIFHIASETRNEVQTITKQAVKKCLRDVSLVGI